MADLKLQWSTFDVRAALSHLHSGGKWNMLSRSLSVRLIHWIPFLQPSISCTLAMQEWHLSLCCCLRLCLTISISIITILTMMWAGRYGDKGRPGSAGLPGTDGLPGDKGSRGRPGSRGRSGAKGQLGSSGRDGLPGIPGTKGFRGLIVLLRLFWVLESAWLIFKCYYSYPTARVHDRLGSRCYRCSHLLNMLKTIPSVLQYVLQYVANNGHNPLPLGCYG